TGFIWIRKRRVSPEKRILGKRSEPYAARGAVCECPLAHLAQNRLARGGRTRYNHAVNSPTLSGSRVDCAPAPVPMREARSLGELSALQWKSGIAAWLGWLFDGLDMHLYTLVAAPFVMQLLHAAGTADPMVKEKSSWIQAAFLVGWALGGGCFGRIG